MTKQEIKKEIAKWHKLLQEDGDSLSERKTKIDKFLAENKAALDRLEKEQEQIDSEIKDIFDEFDQKMMASLPQD